MLARSSCAAALRGAALGGVALRGAARSAAPVFGVAHPRAFASMPDEAKPWYVLGVQMGHQMGDIKAGVEVDSFLKGLTDKLNGTVDESNLSKEDSDKMRGGRLAEPLSGGLEVLKILQGRQKVREDALRDASKGAATEIGNKVLEAAAKEPGALKLPSGVVVVHGKEGEGAQPTLTDKVKLHYKGSLHTGKVFDNSRDRGDAPTEFPMSDVIPGFSQGLAQIKVGGSAKIVIPYEEGYGDQDLGQGLIPAFSVLIFEVEVVGVTPK